MRPQQRKFIVEVKSARRRSTIRPSSIWGDTDLKALVREAEADAPHLFEPAARAGELFAAPPVDDSVVIRTPHDAAEIFEPAELTQDARGIQDASACSSIPLPQEDRANPALAAPERRRRARTMRDAANKGIAVASEVSNDELVALEEENRRLKGLLVRRLQLENTQLRKMLERFGAN
uniref:hypothetical protein n=1 Tax=Ensifer adhaerens TaxID=106592 RepID=UPI003F4954A0